MKPLILSDILATAESLNAPVAARMVVGSTAVLDVLRRTFTAPTEPVAWWLSPYGIPIVIDPLIGATALEVHDQYGAVMMRVEMIGLPEQEPLLSRTCGCTVDQDFWEGRDCRACYHRDHGASGCRVLV